MTAAEFRVLALSMTGSHEEPHFDRTSFRVGKRIYATMTADGAEAMVPVLPVARCLALIEAEPSRYFGHGGWTRRLGALGIHLARVTSAAHVKLVGELLLDAWTRVAPKTRTPRHRGPRSGT
jgi:hypothetical protein